MGGRQSVVVVFFLTQPAICSMCRHPLLAHSQGHVAASHRSGRNVTRSRHQQDAELCLLLSSWSHRSWGHHPTLSRQGTSLIPPEPKPHSCE